MLRTNTIPIAKRLLHVAALGFTAFWLIATSDVVPPARDCFTGLPSRTRISIVLGSSLDGSKSTQHADSAVVVDGAAADSVSDDVALGVDGGSESRVGAEDLPSCLGLDGLDNHRELLLNLEQRARPAGHGCYGFTALDVEGLTGVTVTVKDPYVTATTLTRTAGSFVAVGAEAAGCRGLIEFSLDRADAIPSGVSVDPRHAGVTERWVIERTLQLEQAQFCPGFDARGPVRCQDRFEVASLREVPVTP